MTLKRRITPYDIATREAVEDFHNLDLMEPSRPNLSSLPELDLVNMEPVLPIDLTSISSQDLGRYYSAFQAYHKYVIGQTAMAHIERVTQEKNLSLLKRSLKMQYHEDKKVLKKDIPDLVASSEVFIGQDAITEKAANLHRLLEAKESMYKKDINLLSRELSRRLGELEVDSRGGRFSKNYERTSWNS